MVKKRWQRLGGILIVVLALVALLSLDGKAALAPRPWSFSEVLLWSSIAVVAGLVLLFITKEGK